MTVKWDDHPTNPNGTVGLSPRTINNTIRNLKSLFNWATAEKYYSESPMANIKYQTQDEEHFEVFSDDQVLKLLQEPHRKSFTGFRDYVMMLVLIDTGMSIGELTSLKVSDIDFQLNQIVIPGSVTKTKQTRVAPISHITSHELRELIAYCNLEEDDYVWITQFRERYMADTFGKMLKKYAKKAGITNVRVSPHTFRHYFATKFLLNGGDPVALQRILGHRDIKMISIYVKYTKADLREQHERYSPVLSLNPTSPHKKRGKVKLK
jgi:integrase/recombinase XerD